MSKLLAEIASRALKLALHAEYASLWRRRSQPGKGTRREAQDLVRLTRHCAGENSLLAWIPEIALNDWGEIACYMKELHEAIVESIRNHPMARSGSFAKLGYFAAASRLLRLRPRAQKQVTASELFLWTGDCDFSARHQHERSSFDVV